MTRYRPPDDSSVGQKTEMPSDKVSAETHKALWRVPEFFPELGSKLLDSLLIYQQELIRFNGRINLISTRSEANVDLVHISDSILASQLILKATDQREIFDIGTGNGLPGVVLALLAPERQIVFVDKDARKIEFIKHICSRLAIKNASYLHSRVEDLEKERIHCAVSRGFASIAKSLLLLRKATAPGAEYFHIKSDSWTREVADIPSQICSFWTPSLVGNYSLPSGPTAIFSVVLTKRK